MNSKAGFMAFAGAGLSMGVLWGGFIACKQRGFNADKSSAASSADEGVWSTHPTSALFKEFNPKTVAQAAKVAESFLASASKEGESNIGSGPAAAEVLSARHQQDLLRLVREKENRDYFGHVVNMAKLSAPEFGKSLDKSLSAEKAIEAVFLCGVADTDKGKLSQYKLLLKPPLTPGDDNGKSERLFNTVRGFSRESGGKVLEQVLSEAGFKGLWLLNPNAAIGNDTLRAHFAQKPILANWMHEFPGMADALELHTKGVYSDAALKEILSIALFHNGPDAGYWNKVTTVFLPDDAFGAGAAALRDLYSDTLYESLARASSTGKPVAYPLPTTYLSLVHVVLDRLSQGTLGGVHKIWYEISAFTKPPKMVEELLVVNQAGTLEQLAALKSHVQSARMQSEVAAPGRLLPAQVQSLVALIDAASARVKALQAVLTNGVKITKRDDKTKAPLEATLELSDGTKTIDASVDAPTALGWILTLLSQEQASTQNGEPFRTVFAAAQKTVNSFPSP
ncbi:MAG: hypothetical protein IOD12_13840 [Silvanigrellales bacterium]|nr:hypothetical protein [Silvanigrellales bacterium]